MNFNFFNSNNNNNSNSLSTSFLALGMGGAAFWSANQLFSSNKHDIFNFKNLNFGFNSSNNAKVFDLNMGEKMKGFSFEGESMTQIIFLKDHH